MYTDMEIIILEGFMKITALVENQSNSTAKAVHGLALYIETPGHRLLFDVGPDSTLFENSGSLGIDLLGIDTVVISHGHKDHGGALEQFLKLNHSAKVYIQRKAFENHYSKSGFLKGKVDIGLVPNLQTHPQVILLDGDYSIDDELSLFTTPEIGKCKSDANKTLYSDSGRDDFSHEQSLMIFGGKNVIILGCGHAGVVNIMEKAAEYAPVVCVGGYHLWNPTTKKTVRDKLLESITTELAKYDVEFYTCHCTGQTAYRYFSERLSNMNYLYCGETIEV